MYQKKKIINFESTFKIGENIKEKVSQGPTNVELIQKSPYRPGTL